MLSKLTDKSDKISKNNTMNIFPPDSQANKAFSDESFLTQLPYQVNWKPQLVQMNPLDTVKYSNLSRRNQKGVWKVN